MSKTENIIKVFPTSHKEITFSPSSTLLTSFCKLEARKSMNASTVYVQYILKYEFLAIDTFFIGFFVTY